MQSNNPFRVRQQGHPPAPLADQYYATPPVYPAPQPSTAHAQSTEVESLARAFDQELSLQEQPRAQSQLHYNQSTGYPSHAPAPYHDPSSQNLPSAQWSSLQPPPSYSELGRPPSAPPQTHVPDISAYPPPSMPDARPHHNIAGIPRPDSPAYLGAEDEKRRLHDRYREEHRDVVRDARLPSNSGASSSQARALPTAGPSQPPSGSTLDKVLGRINPRNPLDPPPPSFSRPVPPYIVQGHAPPAPSYPGYPGGGPLQPLAPFPPMTLFAKDKFLEGGFPLLPPPCAMQPHPFSHRDVLEADWVRFLEDLQIAGRLTGGQKVVAGVLPMTMNIGLAGLFVSKAIEKGMKKKNSGPVAELVDTWNHSFFRLRRLHVILARGPENLSGQADGPAPDWADFGSRSHGRSSHGRSRSSSSSSSSSSDGHRHTRREDRRHLREQRRDDKRARRADRRARREARRDGKRHDRRGNAPEERYRLVVVSI